MSDSGKQEISGVGVEALKRFIADHPDWLVIDHTQMEKWESCHRRYKYEYVDKLTRVSSYDAEFGAMLHEMLSEWYEAHGKWHPTVGYMSELYDRFQQNCWNASPPPNNRMGVFTQQHAMTCFNEYTIRYTPDFQTYEVVTSEELYFRQIADRVLWLSKPDLVLRRIGDQQLVTLDFKHSVWDFNRSLLEFDRQFIGQAFAAQSKWMIKAFFHSQLPRRVGEPPTVQIYRPTEPADGELVAEWIDETRAAVKPILEARDTGVYQKRSPRACMDFNRLCEFHDLCVLGRNAAQIMIDSREKVNPNEYLGL